MERNRLFKLGANFGHVALHERALLTPSAAPTLRQCTPADGSDSRLEASCAAFVIRPQKLPLHHDLFQLPSDRSLLVVVNSEGLG